MKHPNWCRQVVCISWRKAVTADSGVAWVLTVGGQGLDLGDWQVNGAGGGDRRQGPTGAVTTGVRGRVGHLDRQRRRTTQMRTGPVEGDRAECQALGFVEAGLSGCGCGCSWWWRSGAQAASCSAGVRMPMAQCGRMVPVPVDPLGGGDHGRRRCPPKGPGYGSARPCTRSSEPRPGRSRKEVSLGAHRGDRLALGQGGP